MSGFETSRSQKKTNRNWRIDDLHITLLGKNLSSLGAKGFHILFCDQLASHEFFDVPGKKFFFDEFREKKPNFSEPSLVYTQIKALNSLNSKT